MVAPKPKIILKESIFLIINKFIFVCAANNPADKKNIG